MEQSTAQWLSTKLVDDDSIDDEDREEQLEFVWGVSRNDVTWEDVLFQLWKYGNREEEFEEYVELYINGDI